METRPRADRASTTGRTRRRSSSSGTGSAPGRVDSPPTSTTSAPSANSSIPWAMAASGSSHLPPSENESGVTFTTPSTKVTVPEVIGRARPVRDPASALDEGHGFGSCAGVLPEEAPDGRGHGGGAGLVDAPHRHAEVLGLQDHEHAPGLEHPDEGVRHLGG